MAKKNRNKYVDHYLLVEELGDALIRIDCPANQVPARWRDGYRLKGRWSTGREFVSTATRWDNPTKYNGYGNINHKDYVYFENADDAFWFTLQMGK